VYIERLSYETRHEAPLLAAAAVVGSVSSVITESPMQLTVSFDHAVQTFKSRFESNVTVNVI